ncbi:MAG: peptidoglycan-binding domain-containing protein, partial [Clostridia bacterium]|nr:peptidoglycan-binding domain-containing protein [Clostridia bacterium]
MKKFLSTVVSVLFVAGNVFSVEAKDIKVEEAQNWLNNTYSNSKGYKSLNIDGNPGTITSCALVSALQIELGIDPTGIFGPKTEEKFNSVCGSLKFGNRDSDKPYIRILQHGLFCKGYNPTEVSGNFGEKTSAAIIKLKKDAGFTDTKDATVDGMWMKAILSSDAYVCRNRGDKTICNIQRGLNREYSRYSGIIPCDGHYSRDTNKALISAF